MRDFDHDQIPVRKLDPGEFNIDAANEIAGGAQSGQRVIFQSEIELRCGRIIRVKQLRWRGDASIKFSQFQSLRLVARLRQYALLRGGTSSFFEKSA